MKHRIILLIALSILLISGSIQAQQTDTGFTVAYLSYFFDSFKAGMTELGYVEGENITYLLPSYENYETLTPEQAMEQFNAQLQAMVDAGVDVFVSNTDSDAVFMTPVIGDVPIVFGRADDPVATGAVANLVSPGGNITGTVTNRPHERRLQLLTEIAPATDTVYYLYSALVTDAETVLQQVETVAEELNVEIVPASMTDLDSAMALLDTIPEDTDWIFLTPNIVFDLQFTEALVNVSMTEEIGISYIVDEPTPGYLMGYGPNLPETERQAAQIVDRILRGASPAELPVQTAENYLMVNLEAAEAIGMEIPESILRQANTIVRPGYFDNLPPITFGG